MDDTKKNIKECAIVIPSYPPHYNFLARCIASIKERCESDIFVVFSNEKEYEYANVIIDGFEPIIIPDSIIVDRGIINKKKIFALERLTESKKYKYVIVLDDETIMNKSVNLLELCENYWDKRILYANKYRVSQLENIIKESLSVFGEKSRENFWNKYHDLYLWFNQPAIYRIDTIKDFLLYTGLNININEITFNMFDYYMYMIYLVEKHNFNIVDIGAISDYGFMEAISTRNLVYDPKRIREYNFIQSTRVVSKLLKIESVFIVQEDKSKIGIKEKIYIYITRMRNLIRTAINSHCYNAI